MKIELIFGFRQRFEAGFCSAIPFLPKQLISLLFLFLLNSRSIAAISVAGPVSINNVAVTGAVTVSSMTVSTLTVTSLLQAPSTNIGIPVGGRTTQILFSSTTTGSSVTANTWTAIPVSKSITPTSETDYVHISLTGCFCANGIGYLTIFRDSTNLGDSTFGLINSGATSGSEILNQESSGISIIDSPGDTVSHQYQVYLREDSSYPPYFFTQFPCYTTAFLLLEDVHP